MDGWHGGDGVQAITLQVDARAVDWSRATEVYQVKRDGVWHDETREQFLRRPFGEQWRVRLVSGVVLAEQGHEHPKRPEANERDGREEKAQAQGEGERAAPAPARAPMHDAPQEQVKDE